MHISSFSKHQPKPVNPSSPGGSGVRRTGRLGMLRLALATMLLGLAWGVTGQALRDLSLVSDWVLIFLSLLVLLALFLFAAYKLELEAQQGLPLKAGVLASLFLACAVTSHYTYYIVTLALGLGYQGASLDLGRSGTYRVLWQLFKTSIAQWLLLALTGGLCLGALLGWLLPVLGPTRIDSPASDGRR